MGNSKSSSLRPGLEPGPDGHPIGRDPRQMSPAEIKKAGHMPAPPLAAIRAHCIDCCGGQLGEVRHCVATGCDCWPYRMGVNVWLPKPSAAQRRQRAMALERASAKKSFGRPDKNFRDPERGQVAAPDLGPVKNTDRSRRRPGSTTNP